MLVIGDSLSAAYGLRTEQGWVQLLQQRLTQQGLAYHVVNASISGATSANGLAQGKDLINSRQPELVIIALGANDGLRGLPLEQMQDNLGQLITLAQQAGSQVLLLGMRLPPNYGPDYTQQFAQVYERLAQQHRIAWLPFLLDGIATEPELMQDDQLHPNTVGQQRILELVWPAVAKLAQRNSSENQ